MAGGENPLIEPKGTDNILIEPKATTHNPLVQPKDTTHNPLVQPKRVLDYFLKFEEGEFSILKFVRK